MIPMATMSTKFVGINTVDRGASQTTRSPRNVSGLDLKWTSRDGCIGNNRL